MQKKILGTLFSLLFLGVSTLLYTLFNPKEEAKIEVLKDPPLPTNSLSLKSETSNAWMKEMAVQDTKAFSFPVNELFMQIGAQETREKKRKAFRLVIEQADRYSLFCIIQTLSTLKLPYMIIKEQKAPLIYVQEKSEKALEPLILELQKYEIASKIIEVML